MSAGEAGGTVALDDSSGDEVPDVELDFIAAATKRLGKRPAAAPGAPPRRAPVAKVKASSLVRKPRAPEAPGPAVKRPRVDAPAEAPGVAAEERATPARGGIPAPAPPGPRVAGSSSVRPPCPEDLVDAARRALSLVQVTKAVDWELLTMSAADRSEASRSDAFALVENVCRSFQRGSASFLSLLSRQEMAHKAEVAATQRAEDRRAAAEAQRDLAAAKLTESERRLSEVLRELDSVRGALEAERKLREAAQDDLRVERQSHEASLQRAEKEKKAAGKRAVEAYTQSQKFNEQIDSLFLGGFDCCRRRALRRHPELDLAGLSEEEEEASVGPSEAADVPADDAPAA